MPRYPRIEDDLHRQLMQVAPSHHGELVYRPCLVTLDDGVRVDCVYLVPEGPWARVWRTWPEEVPAAQWLDVRRVVAIADSPHRLPPRIADKIYEAGESGPGYYLFALRFQDGGSQAYLAGQAVDFVELPTGRTEAEIIDVRPHEGREEENVRRGLEYRWCPFGE